jgi:uncharacterized protein (TIGR00299 family) protein
MKTLYLDIFSGISGDMFIGALIDLGVDLHRLEHELEKLRLDGWHLHAAHQHKANIAGIKFDVRVAGEHDHQHEHARARSVTHAHAHSHSHGHEHEHDGHDHEHEREHDHDDHNHEGQAHGRNFAQIKELIARSALSDWVKQKSLGVFQRIAVAEGKIHGLPPEQVHFHEVGAVDSIVDIVGACVALEMLGKPRILAGPVVEGTGWIDCAHGRFPIPAPATLEILGARGVPISQCDEPNELVTPTGAALLAEFVESFGPMQGLAAEKIGFGLGTRENKTRPNALRAILGETAGAAAGANDWQTDTVAVLETNLDDTNAEILGHFVELALAAGALDVFHTPVQMKKNRPGVLLTALCAVEKADEFTELMLRETSAFGVRRSITERRKLHREFASVQTRYGEATVKLGRLNGKVVQAAPEFESCKKLAEQAKAPLKQVYEAVVEASSKLKISSSKSRKGKAHDGH